MIPGDKNVPRALVDGIVFTLLKEGFDVVDRAHLKTLMKESELSFSGLTERKNMIKLGKLANINVVCVVSRQYDSTQYVSSYKDTSFTGLLGYVRITIKMIDLETGRYLYVFESKKISYDYELLLALLIATFFLAFPVLFFVHTDEGGAERAIMADFERDLKKKFQQNP